MKKLLFIVSLMMLGANAFAADATVGPASGDKATAEVLVKAEITDDSFTITDIFGKPLVLDFGRLAKTQAEGKVWTAEVEYKITATKAPDTEKTFDVALKDTTVKLKHVNNALPNDGKNILTSTLALDEESKVMAGGTDVVTGFISGSIVENIKDKVTGMYQERTELTATVQ